MINTAVTLGLYDTADVLSWRSIQVLFWLYSNLWCYDIHPSQFKKHYLSAADLG